MTRKGSLLVLFGFAPETGKNQTGEIGSGNSRGKQHCIFFWIQHTSFGGIWVRFWGLDWIMVSSVILLFFLFVFMFTRAKI
ncbi:hypothetical protein VTJ04DRAFT_3392 [Mycothermus thermophilus]|uniref:uncharacterized protein n=1 Tax=Humicola insolens TaxID=85995 RepID=UPI003743285D